MTFSQPDTPDEPQDTPDTSTGAPPAPQDAEQRHVNGLTPVLDSIGNIGSVIAFAAFLIIVPNLAAIRGLFDSSAPSARSQPTFAVAGLPLIFVFLMFLVLIIANYLMWSFLRFSIDSEAVRLRTGVISKEVRDARLDRVEAIDIIQPFVAKPFGLGKLVIETAGGDDSNVIIGYLTMEELATLRQEILTAIAVTYGSSNDAAAPPILAEALDEHAERQAVTEESEETAAESVDSSDAATTTATPQGAGQPTPTSAPAQSRLAALSDMVMADRFNDDNYRPVWTVPAGRLLASVVLVFIPQVVIVGIIVVGILLYTSLEFGIDAFFGLGSAAILPIFFAILGVFRSTFTHLNDGWGFRASTDGDSIRMRYGLTTTKTNTVTLRRVQSVTVRQPWYWRIFGWYRVEMTVAGYGTQSEESKAPSRSPLVPVGTKSEVLQALSTIFPDPGVAHPNDFVESLLQGSYEDAPVRAAPAQAKWRFPLTWRRKALGHTPTMVVLCDGFFTRITSFVPHARVQSWRVRQGPWSRALGVASLHLDRPAGPGQTHISGIDQRLALGELSALTAAAQALRQAERARRERRA